MDGTEVSEQGLHLLWAQIAEVGSKQFGEGVCWVDAENNKARFKTLQTIIPVELRDRLEEEISKYNNSVFIVVKGEDRIDVHRKDLQT